MRPLSLRQSFLLVALLWLAIGGLQAAGDRAYDLLGSLIRPYAALFAEDTAGPRALTLSLRLEESKGYSSELAGLHAEIAVEYPDKLRLRAPLFGQEYTLCRRGQTLWVYPGSKLRALLAEPEIARQLPPPDRKYQVRPFRLPIPEKQLVFLPALFKATSGPAETIENVPCEVLDLKATPLLGRALDLDAWSARVWLAPQARPMRFQVTGPATRITGRVEKADFARTLPPETWVPAKEQEGDVAIVPPARYDQLLRAILGLR